MFIAWKGICFTDAVNDSRDVTTPIFFVGDLVQLRRRGVTITGRVVEDFGDYLVPADRLGQDWASPQRWAIAAEYGTLMFADDDLTAAPTTDNRPSRHRSSWHPHGG